MERLEQDALRQTSAPGGARAALISVVMLCFTQALLIAWALIYRARWKRAVAGQMECRRAVQDLSHRLVTVQEEERRRLARELHDSMTQRLGRLAIDVGLVERSVGTALGKVRDGLVGISEDVHAISYSLHPSFLEDLGLVEALQVECSKFTEQSSIQVDLAERDLPAAIPRDVTLCLFRIVQEALRNVERHARASSVEVSVHGDDDGIYLLVRDDGIGIDPSLEREQPGLGLVSMRERTDMLAGTFEIDSRPGQGTALLAFLPLQERRT